MNKQMFQTQYNKELKLWSHIPSLYNPKISLGQVILRACGTFGSKIAQISNNSGIQLSYDEIRIRTIRAAQNLQRYGINTKVVFGVMAKNSHHLAPIVFASMCLGCPVNALDPTFKKSELLHMLKTTEPTLMFCDSEAFDLVKECLIELGNQANIFVFGDARDGAESVENLFVETHDEDTFVPVEVDGESDAVAIVCSSGTTGMPKGVCLSHAAVLDMVIQFNVISSSDILLAFSSLYWLSGWVVLLLGTLNGATRIISTHSYSPELQLQLIEQYKVTFSWNAPHHVVLMLKSNQIHQTDLSSLKFQLIIGGKTPYQVQTEFSEMLPNGKVHICYGLSETAGIVAINTNGKDVVGQLMSGYHVKIVDDDGNRCGMNQNGEICVKCHYKFLGYFGNQKATAELYDEEGFILTGDIGHFDENGDLSIIDRKKELIKYCNFQISPSEIEAFLLESSDIKSVCVIGIPDKTGVNKLQAAFVIRNEHSNITETDITAMVAAQFADHCKLRGGVHFVDALPMTPSGKLLRRQLRQSVLAMK